MLVIELFTAAHAEQSGMKIMFMKPYVKLISQSDVRLGLSDGS